MYTHTPFSRPERRNENRSSQQFTELYFSYSSNMSPSTMKGRYPNSLFCGMAKLTGWRWYINSTQYANIVKSEDESDVVYGAIYFISSADETDLDVSEGVPDHYDKQWHEVIRLGADGGETGQTVRALMHVDSQRPDEGIIKDDYVVRIRKAIRDAKPYGLPDSYVDKCIRPWLPENEGDEVEEDMNPIRIMFPKNAFA